MTAVVTPPEYGTDPYLNLLVQASIDKAKAPATRRLLVGVPTLGLIRMEWAQARYGQVVPCNWSMSEHKEIMRGLQPLGYDVKDARNVIVQHAVESHFEWLFFNDDDTILPFDCFCKLNRYMQDGTIPVVSGLYTTKSIPAEPLAYRGRGNSYYGDFKVGDQVWLDGTGCGCLLLNMQVVRLMWADAPQYLAGGTHLVRMVFDTPSFSYMDPEIGVQMFSGTEDLSFFDRMIQGDYLGKAGFKKVAKKKYPLLMDSSIACYHIEKNGIVFPQRWEW